MEYTELVAIVQEIEGNSTRPEINFLDISPISEKNAAFKKSTFKEMIIMAMSIESLHMQESQQKQKSQQQKPQAFAASAQPIQKQAAQQKASAPAPQAMQVQQMQAPKPDQKKIAKQEIISYLSKLPKLPLQPIKPFSINIKNKNDSILLKLSVTDQVSELEKIIEGLKEHVFGDKQIAIVKSELLALKSWLDKGKGHAPAASSNTEQVVMLGILRDQRLEEALGMVGVANGTVQ
jgi:hypothetical protein